MGPRGLERGGGRRALRHGRRPGPRAGRWSRSCGRRAAASAFVLRAGWGVKAIGKTVGYCLVQQGSPSASEMEQLLALAAKPIKHGDQGANVRKAALGDTCSAPYWPTVIGQLPNFQDNWVGPRGQGGSSASWAGPVVRSSAHDPGRADHPRRAGPHLRVPRLRLQQLHSGGGRRFGQLLRRGDERAGQARRPARRATVRRLAENAHHGHGATQGDALDCTVAVKSISGRAAHPPVLSQRRDPRPRPDPGRDRPLLHQDVVHVAAAGDDVRLGLSIRGSTEYIAVATTSH